MRRTLMIFFIVRILVITACDDLPVLTGTPGDQEDVDCQPSAGLASPASEYCLDQGGELEIRDEEGGQVGYCIFADGSECEEWAFFRGECAPAGGQETSDTNPSQAYQPLDPAACSDVAKAVQETFTLDVATEQVAFADYVSGETGTGCQATALGSGYDFGSLAEASAILGVMLEARGWEEDMQYQADGPTGMATAYRLDDALCLVNIN